MKIPTFKQFGQIIKSPLFISKYTTMTNVNLRLILVFILSICFYYSTINWSNSDREVKKLKIEIEKLKNERDSFETLSSSCEINLKRYEITLEELEISNPKLGRKFKKILNQYSE